MRALIDAHPDEAYVLVYGDIDRFKAYNDLFGTSAGDALLADIGEMIRRSLPANAAAARLRADHFVGCFPRSLVDPDRMLASFNEWFRAYRQDFTFFVRMGVYPIDDPELDVGLMCDRALLALRAAKGGTAGSRYVLYDETLRVSLLKEQQLAGEMTAALDQGQFVPFFQPQYRYATGLMTGAEVLARWQHPERGLLGPAEFIPVFERNGLISRFDYYMWDQACRCLRAWIDERGIEAVPHLSVNLSRADIYRPDLCSYLTGLVERYDVPASLLNLEITESAYMESPDQLIGAVRELRAAGFTVEMDDFGSGFSSLNTLKDVPVDVLKLDMGFLDTHESTRGGLILASIVRMARWLDLPTIAEGVETSKQAAYLASIGCEYMQGYLFSRPVDRETFERMLSEGGHEGFSRSLAEAMQDDAAEFWNADSQLALIFNSYVGPAAIAEYDGEALEIVRVNRGFAALFDMPDDPATSERLRRNLLAQLLEEDRASLREAIRRAVAGEGDAESELRFRANGVGRWIRIRVRLLSRAGDLSNLYLLAEETTQEQALRDRLAATRDTIPGGLAFYEVSERIKLLDFSDMTAGMLGFAREEYRERAQADALAVVHPDDRPLVEDIVAKLSAGASRGSCVMRAMRRDGGVSWLHLSASAMYRDEAALYAVAVLIDVTNEKEGEQRLRVLCSVYDEIIEFDGERGTCRSLYSSGRSSASKAMPLDEAFEFWTERLPDVDDRARLRAALDECLESEGEEPIVCAYRRDYEGRRCWYQSTLLRMSESGVLCCSKDVTERMSSEDRERSWQNERYRLLSEMTHKMSFDYDSDSDTVLLYIDRGKGVEAQVIPRYLETLATTRGGVLHPESIDGVRSMFENARDGADAVGVEYRADYYGTGYAWYRANLFVAHDGAGSWHLVGLIEDIDNEHDLRIRAERDATTGLSNHAATQDLVAAALSDASVRSRSVCVALDIDDFKRVNDTHGHLVGDMLLHEVGSVLRASFRETDVVGRVGGDEFVLLLKGIGLETALGKLEQVRRQLAAVKVGALEHAPSVSMGVYVPEDDDAAYRDVFVKADEALYRAKRSGKNRICVHGDHAARA